MKHTSISLMRLSSVFSSIGHVLFSTVLFVVFLSSCSTGDPVERKINALLVRMTLEEKIGQMNQLDLSWDGETKEQLIREGKAGSIFNIVDTREINRLQHIAVEESRLGIPLVVARDVIHGYRYIEISGLDNPLPLNSVQGVVLSSIPEDTVSYETSNKDVNRLEQNVRWSAKANFFAIPTDCPQRNERMGWSGDLAVFSNTAVYLANSDNFLRQHMQTLRDLQATDGRFTEWFYLGQCRCCGALGTLSAVR